MPFASDSALALILSLFSSGRELNIVAAARKSSDLPVSAAFKSLLATPSVPIVFDVSAKIRRNGLVG